MQNKLVTLLLLAAACSGDGQHPLTPDAPPPPPPDSPPPPVDLCDQTPSDLRTDLAWYGDNRATLQGWLDSAGCKSATYDKAHKPIALWDWDNTISKNDFGDAITYYMVANGKVLQPPNQDWQQTSPFLTSAAVSALSAACGTTVAAGQPLPTNTSAYANCADEILWIYDNSETRAHAAAFLPGNARRNVPDFAWTPQLMAGYTHAELQQFSLAAATPMLAAAEGTTQTIGTTVENGWLRLYDQQKDLIHAAQTRGYDVWIITASPQDTIGAIAPMVGVAYDHVVGIRSMLDGSGKTTYKFEGCGPYPDNQTDVIPHIQGKRCFVNKVVFGDTSATAIERRPDGQRQVFASADTDADLEFLRDANYKLVINRNKPDLMCHAYYNEHDTWRINPIFIGPKAALTAPYSCATAFTDETGAPGASRDEGGNLIPDQTDSVHP
jgi:hypothetical protein